MGVLRVKVKGLPPGLLMANPASMVDEAMEPETDEKLGRRKEKKLPPKEAAAKLVYRLPGSDQLGFPGVAFQKVILAATKGKSYPRAGGGKALSALTVMAGIFEVEPKDLLPITRNGKPVKKYEIDVRTGLNQNTKPPARIVLARPLVRVPWEMEFDVIWNERFAPEGFVDKLRELLELGGTSIGIGAFRPDTSLPGKGGGWFGKFEVVSIEAQDGT